MVGVLDSPSAHVQSRRWLLWPTRDLVVERPVDGLANRVLGFVDGIGKEFQPINGFRLSEVLFFIPIGHPSVDRLA